MAAYCICKGLLSFNSVNFGVKLIVNSKWFQKHLKFLFGSLSSTKKKDICFQQMSFFLGSAAWAAPSSVIEMLGANEIAPVLRFCLRQNARTAQMRRATVCPTGTYMVL